MPTVPPEAATATEGTPPPPSSSTSSSAKSTSDTLPRRPDKVRKGEVSRPSTHPGPPAMSQAHTVATSLSRSMWQVTKTASPERPKPGGLKRHKLMGPWPDQSRRCRHSPVAVSHRRTVSSPEALARRAPPGDRAMSVTILSWSPRTRRHSPVAAHHCRTSLSVEPVKSWSPLGAKASAVMRPVCPVSLTCSVTSTRAG